MGSCIELSVIIPTYNRKEVLEKCLGTLAHQRVATKYEILVIDDGSSDGTKTLVNNLKDNFPVTLRYYGQPNRGPAAARNIGILNAHGRLLLFIGDDIIPRIPSFLEEHLKWHRELYPDQEIAVLGFTTWSSELKISPYMLWLENSGHQFCYNMLKHGEFADSRYFYTSNISFKKSFLGKDLFDEKFPHAAFEDYEFGYRLSKRGLKIVFNKQALADHYHQITLENYCNRALVAGKSAAILASIHPELFNKKIKPLWRRFAKRLIFDEFTIPFWLRVAKFCEERCQFPLLFSSLYSHYFWKGFRQGTHDKAGLC